MNTIQPLEYDSYFHIYNRGINSTILFKDSKDYELFLNKYFEYISPVADTLAWCLMKNHFHFLVRILPVDKISFIKEKEQSKIKYSERKKYNPTKQFSHLFNSHTKYFNAKHKRTGGLFETPFRRIKIDSDVYLKNLVSYIHSNPVKHGCVDNVFDYPWSSYLSIMTINKKDDNYCKTLGLFNSKNEFIELHKENKNFDEFTDYNLE